MTCISGDIYQAIVKYFLYDASAKLIFYRLMAAMRVKHPTAKQSQLQPFETSESINNQIAAFMESGGEIQQIAKGVSGQTFSPSSDPRSASKTPR